MSYDAFLLVSFGGPEKPDDVMPFLENVVRGKRVPRERLLEVAEHYHHCGGKSPINDQNRALKQALEEVLELPVYWGNRNWHPLLSDTLRQMKGDGVRRAIGFITSAYGSYSGCRQYREDLARAREEIGAGAPEIDVLRRFFDHPGFVEPLADNVREAIDRFDGSSAVRVVYTAHSIPNSMAESSPYVGHLEATAALVSERAGVAEHDLVWQSRSGPPQVPWLEPDVVDHLATLAKDGVRDVVVAPIGFVSDHMEVVWDLDHEAADAAKELGLRMERARTVGVDPRFVAMVAELVRERTEGAERRALSVLGPAPDVCAPDCCPAPRRPGR